MNTSRAENWALFGSGSGKRLVGMDDYDRITVADVETCNDGDYLVLWADLPAGAVRPTETDPALVERLTVRGLRPAFDKIGMYVLHVDEIDDLIHALASRAGAIAEQILASDGFGPEECQLERCLAALRAYRRLAKLPVEELRRRGALISAVAGC